jgi:hypothetical protein
MFWMQYMWKARTKDASSDASELLANKGSKIIISSTKIQSLSSHRNGQPFDSFFYHKVWLIYATAGHDFTTVHDAIKLRILVTQRIHVGSTVLWTKCRVIKWQGLFVRRVSHHISWIMTKLAGCIVGDGKPAASSVSWNLTPSPNTWASFAFILLTPIVGNHGETWKTAVEAVHYVLFPKTEHRIQPSYK